MHAWREFKEGEIDRMTVEFLHEHGVEPEWI